MSDSKQAKPYPVQQQSGYNPANPQPIRPPVAQFDQTANIDPNKPVNIPPPPPGYAPTDAQLAHQKGQSVQITQQKKDMLGGGADGGVTIW